MDMQTQAQIADIARPLAGKVAIVTGSTSGIGLGIARALAQAGADVVINGLGDPKAIESVCEELENGSPVQPRRLQWRQSDGRQPRPASWSRTRSPISAASTSSSTMPASSTSARSRASRPRNMTRSSRSTCRRPGTRSAPSFASMKEQRLRPDHQRRLGPRPGRLALQERLCRRQAWRRRPDQDGRARRRRAWRHLQRHLPRLCLDAAGRKPDRRHRQGARDQPRGSDPRRAARGPAEQALRHRRGARRARRVPVRAPAASRSPAPPCRSTAAGRRIEMTASVAQGRDRRRRLRRAGRCQAAGRQAGRRHAWSTGATTTCSSRCSTKSRPRRCRRPTLRRRSARSCRTRATSSVVLDEVTGVDAPANRVLLARSGSLEYDWLILATGARHSYFGRDEWARACAGPEEHRGRHRDPPAGAACARTCRDGERSRAPPRAAHLRRHRRRTDRSRNGRRHRRAGAAHGLARFPQHHAALLARHPDRGGPARSCRPFRPTWPPRPSIRCANWASRSAPDRRSPTSATAGSRSARSGSRPAPLSGRRASRPRRPPNGSARTMTNSAGSSSNGTFACPAIATSSRSATPPMRRAATAERCPASRPSPSSRASMSPAGSSPDARRSIRLSRLWQPRDHRPQARRHRLGRLASQRLCRLADLVVRPHLVPDRLSQPPRRRRSAGCGTTSPSSAALA